MRPPRSRGGAAEFWPAYTDLLMVTSFILILLTVAFSLAKSDSRVPDELKARKARFTKAFKAVFRGSQDIHLFDTDGERLVITFADKLLFEVGRADLNQSGQKALVSIAGLLKQYNNEVMGFRTIKINGHTDPWPIKSAPFPSNWHLSSARATTVLYFLANHSVPEQNMSATGYGPYQPWDPWGKRLPEYRMRRIEIELHYPTEWLARMIGQGKSVFSRKVAGKAVPGANLIREFAKYK